MIGRGEKTSINHWNRKRIWFTLKCRSSKTQVFLLTIRTVFPMFDKKHCIVRRNADTLWCLLGALGISSGNRQRWHRDVPARCIWAWMRICTGCQTIYIIMPKFLVPLPSIIWHPSPTDDAVLLVKATERQFPHQEKPVSKNYWHFKEKNKILFLFQYLEIHFPISQSPNHGIIRIFRVIIRIIIFGTRASRSVKGRCITKVC